MSQFVQVRLESHAPRPETGEHAAEVAHLLIDRPARGNALGSEVMQEFVAALDRLAEREALRAVVLTGAGERAFISGADIDEMAVLDAAGARRFITLVHRCCDVVRRLPVPVIARINGATFGAGLELVAACDLRVAADRAVFGMPEVRLGIPSVVEAALLPGLIGWSATQEMLLLGEVISAARALELGLVQRVAPAGGLDDVVGQWIESLLKNGPRAVRAQKALMRRWAELPTASAVDVGIDVFAASWEHAEPTHMMGSWRRRHAERSKTGG